MPLVERSYIGMLLQAEPDFYARTRNTNRVEYKFSNGREFKGRDLYSNYFPLLMPVYDEGVVVTDESEVTYDEVSWAEYQSEFFR